MDLVMGINNSRLRSSRLMVAMEAEDTVGMIRVLPMEGDSGVRAVGIGEVFC